LQIYNPICECTRQSHKRKTGEEAGLNLLTFSLAQLTLQVVVALAVAVALAMAVGVLLSLYTNIFM